MNKSRVTLVSLALLALTFPLLLGVGRPSDPVPPRLGRDPTSFSTGRFIDARLGEVRFEFDSATIAPDQSRVLEAIVSQLKRSGPAVLLVEGHTDEWGSEEYNLRLGECRALVVRDALVKRGLDPVAITVVSYGKSRPRCREHHRVCWAENRRVRIQALDRAVGLSGELGTSW